MDWWWLNEVGRTEIEEPSPEEEQPAGAVEEEAPTEEAQPEPTYVSREEWQQGMDRLSQGFQDLRETLRLFATARPAPAAASAAPAPQLDPTVEALRPTVEPLFKPELEKRDAAIRELALHNFALKDYLQFGRRHADMTDDEIGKLEVARAEAWKQGKYLTLEEVYRLSQDVSKTVSDAKAKGAAEEKERLLTKRATTVETGTQARPAAKTGGRQPVLTRTPEGLTQFEQDYGNVVIR